MGFSVLSHANSLLAKAILKLEEEFKQLLLSYSKPVEPDRLFDCLPNSLRPSESPGHGKNPSSTNHPGRPNRSLEAYVYTPPTLIPPRIPPLLHDLAQQMIQAGHQQQLHKIYRFKNFNLQFEELHQRQSQWTVPDSELRESLRLAVAEVLLPAYRSFIKRFGPLIENWKNPSKYIRYTPEDLDRMLGDFFEGKTWNEPKR